MIRDENKQDNVLYRQEKIIVNIYFEQKILVIQST